MPNYVVFYRSDTRSPDVMFKDEKGFQPKSPAQGELKALSFVSGPDCVAISEKFAAAAAFPLRQTDSWVYLVAVDIEQDEHHYLNFIRHALTFAPEEQLLFQCIPEAVKEHTVSNIPNTHILCAYPIQRFVMSANQKEMLGDFTHFKITGQATHNSMADTLLATNTELTKRYQTKLAQHDAEIGKEQINLLYEAFTKNKIDSFYRTGFFGLNRFSAEAKEVNAKTPLGEAANKAFFSPLSQNERLLFKNRRQLAHQNQLFYTQVMNGNYKDRIEKEKKELAQYIDKSLLNLMDKYNLPPVPLAKILTPEELKEMEAFPQWKAKMGV